MGTKIIHDEKEKKPSLLLTIREAAQAGYMTESALRRGIREGWIPIIRVGNRAYINKLRLIDILNGKP